MIEHVLISSLATLLAAVVFVRAVNVIRKMDVRLRSGSYCRWLAFGVSYAFLAAAAAGTALMALDGRVPFGYLIWLASSAGLILFDRRSRRNPLVTSQAGHEKTAAAVHLVANK